MRLKDVFAKGLQYIKTVFVGITIVQFSFGGLLVGSAEAKETSKTRTPIKHVIVLIGETARSIMFSPLINRRMGRASRTCCQRASFMRTARPGRVSRRRRNSTL